MRELVFKLKLKIARIMLNKDKRVIDQKMAKLAEQYGGQDKIPDEAVKDMLLSKGTLEEARILNFMAAYNELCYVFSIDVASTQLNAELGRLFESRSRNLAEFNELRSLIMTPPARTQIFKRFLADGTLPPDAALNQFPIPEYRYQFFDWLEIDSGFSYAEGDSNVQKTI